MLSIQARTFGDSQLQQSALSISDAEQQDGAASGPQQHAAVPHDSLRPTHAPRDYHTHTHAHTYAHDRAVSYVSK